MTRAPLSPRETEIVQLIAWGMNSPAIAEELGIAVGTVRTHVQNALSATHLHTRTELVVWALQHGLIDLPPPRPD